MARIDKVRESYENVTNRLFADKEAFADYLKFAGKFFKLPSAQSMLVYGANPNASMVAEYETWKKFDRQVKRGTNSIAVLDNGNLKHYFDISQTAGSKTPYQWQLDKNTAAAFIEETFENEGKRFNSLSGCINYLGSEKARENLTSVINSLNISEENRAKFEKSYISMVQFFIAARCELGGSFKYNNKADLSALDMLHSKAEKEKLCEFVQITGKSVLLSMERSINNIIIQGRTVDNGRNKTDMVRGRSDVLPRNQDGERQDVQARSGNVRVSGTVGSGSDGRGTGVDGRGDRTVRGEMESVYDGKSPRSDTVPARSPEMGTDTPTSGQRSDGVSGAAEETVREGKSAPDDVQRTDNMGEHAGNVDRQGDNGGRSADLSGISSEDPERATYSTTASGLSEEENEGATYSTNSTQTKAEDNTPAFSVDDIQKIADNISSISNDLNEKYDGEYREFTLANYAFTHSGAEYDLNISVSENVKNMLSSGEYQFLVGYLKAIYDEAFESRIIVAEGQAAEETLSLIDKSKIDKENPLELSDGIDKFYVNKENESVTWVYYNPDSDKGGQLVYHHFTFDQLFDNLLKDDVPEAITHIAKTELVDVDDPAFKERAQEFLANNEDYAFHGEWDLRRLSEVVDPTYHIFQLYEGREDLRDYRFSSISELKKWGLYVDHENYHRVYRGRLKDGETLEDIYTRFNVNRPDDFRGHSLSVSDVIAIKQGSNWTAHYVDDWGFEEIPDFTLDREERKARRTLTDNIVLYAENQLASDDMDTFCDYLFLNSYNHDALKIGDSGFPLIKLHELAERYKKGEDIRSELGRGMYVIRNHIETYNNGAPNIEVAVSRDENGMTFKTNGGFEIAYSWEQLGEAMIIAAQKEYARHNMWNRASEIADILRAAETNGTYNNTSIVVVNKDGSKGELQYREGELILDTEFYLNNGSVGKSAVDVANYLFENADLSKTADENGIELNYYTDGRFFKEALSVTRKEYDILRKTKVSSQPEYTAKQREEKQQQQKATVSDRCKTILSEVRGGKIAQITEPAEEETMIADARRKKTTNIRLMYNEERGYYLRGDADGGVKNAILVGYGENEQSVLEDLRDYLENNAEINLVEGENPLRFAEIANGIKIYDTSKWNGRAFDYPLLAHIYNDGSVDYYVDKNTLKAEDIEHIEQEADRLKRFFIKEWEKLPIDTRFAQIKDRAVGLSRPQSDIYFADEVALGIEGIVKKYEHALIFRDEEFPAAAKPLTAYRVGDFYELFNEDAKNTAELLDLTQTTRRGVPMVGFPVHAYEKYRRNLAMQGYYLNEGDERDIDKILSAETETHTDNETLEIAKKNISDFCQEEYGTDADFSDLHKIGIAYTTAENGEDMIELQVNADIIDCAIRYYVNDELYKEETYPDLRKMNNEVLAALDFDELYGEFSDIVAEFEPKHDQQAVEQEEQLPQSKAETEHISENAPTQTLDELKVGDLVRGDGQLWKITDISGDFSMRLENTDKSSNLSEQSFLGKWKDQFVKLGYEYVSPKDLSLEQLQEISSPAPAAKPKTAFFPKSEQAMSGAEQLSLFDEPTNEVDVPERTIIEGVDVEKALKRDLVQHGTMFMGGKFRVEEYYYSHRDDIKGFAKALAKEYGTGGHSGDGKIGYTDYNNKGITISIVLENGEKTKVNWSWQKVAKRIATLIDNQEYITQRDIDDRIKYAKYDYQHYEQGSPEHERAAKILDNYGMLPTPAQEQTVETEKAMPKELSIGDKFRNKFTGSIDEVVSLTGALPWNTDQCTISRESDGFKITENENISKILNSNYYEYLGNENILSTAVSDDISSEEKPTVQKSADKPIEIKNLAQLKRALTVGAEFEITSHIRPDISDQLRRVNYVDTTGIYSIRPDAPDDKITLANEGRGSYLQWGKAAEWDFKNDICTLYQKGAEHTPENMLMSLKIKPRVLDKEHSADISQNTNTPSEVDIPPVEPTVEENNEVKLRTTVIDLEEGKVYDTDYQAPNSENIKSADTVESNPIIEKLAKAFSPETAEQLYNAFESNKMADWDSNQAKINRVKRALYDILGNEEQTERAFGIITSATQKPHDFTITDEHLGEGGAKTKYAANIAAIRTLKAIEADERLATPEEQEILSKYVGWGGIPQAFDGENGQWSKEYGELKELLTDEEYRAANASVINAHYTTPTVIHAIYSGLQNLGFEGGNILEPSMGVGNFFGAMPEEMRKNSKLSGVELDSITGRIAKQLYQNADIQVKGFEKTDFSDNFFDVVVGNVPFGNYPVSDKKYNRENFFIHDYFIAKSLDKVAPNGIVAVVTTKGTLDKEHSRVREYLAKRADLVGAIRLPNNAFKANAGTEVTTDILFFQKREKMAVELPDWCYVSQNADGVPVNNYFIEHPEMILGTMKQGLEHSMYGNDKETTCVPIDGADLKEQLEKAVGNLKLNNALRIHKDQREKQAGTIPATADVRNFTFAEIDGKMYFRENNIMTEAADKNGQSLTGKKLDRLKALNELRKTFRKILTEQENDCSDVQLQAYQKILNKEYDDFVKDYGYINDSANYQAFGKDDDYNSLCALEVVNEETKEVTKSDFFSRRTIKHYTEVTHVDTPQEALNVSIDTHGKLDFEYMAKICGKEPQEIINALQADNLIYLNPNKADPQNALAGWEETSEYLSGNVRNKLREAEHAAKDDPAFQRNVEALTAVIPKRIEAGDISARIGIHWVDVKDYQQFMERCLQVQLYSPLRRTFNGEYKIEHKSWNSSAAATQIAGTKRMNALEIFENLLNNRDVVVRDKVKDNITGKEHYVINITETQLAQDKAEKMKAAFARWLWADPERREKYVTRYNELFNSIVGRKYDGSHQTFPGMSPYIKLKPHQLDAVARGKFGGNTLLAHCVGAGKSFEMVAVTMEKKRLGLINKACVVVPKSLVGQMANEWLRLYPQAKILTATEKDFDKDHRQKFIGRCCTGEYDAVIMSYEQFEKIPMSFEYRRDFIQREIDSLTKGISDLSGNYISRQENRGSIKDLERAKKRLEAKLEKLIEDNGKIKDTSLTFEQLGFDSLVVDEAHNYKNGLVVSKMQRVAGVQTTPAQKSEDILMKTQYLNNNYGERNILFATGTPVSNSMTELYIMKRYLRPSLLAQAGLQTFDDWASTFGEVVSKAELKPAGNGYRTKKRFAKFNNLPELMAMYKEFADIRTADMLDLPVPKIEGDKPQTIVASTNDFQKAYMQNLAERSEAVHRGSVDASIDNMLKITGEARLLGLDARCLNPEADNYHDSKVNLCIDKVMEIYTNTTAQKGVQAIFCDIAVNGDNEQEELSDSKQAKKEKPKEDLADEGKFSVYNYIKAELIRRGIPKDEICFAGDADTQKKQNEMRAQLRSGAKRIVIASTSKLGTGANIQNKLVALHNLDIPWKPSDLEQRLGRIVRQGNENDTVQLYNYVTKDTFDAYMLNIIVTKQKFISQLMSGNTTARSCEDVDEMVLNYTEMQALATGDPRIKEKIELDTDVARLKMLESEHYNEQYRLDDTISHAQIAIKNYDHVIKCAKNDLEFAKQNVLPGDGFMVEIYGKVYADRKEAGTALRQAAFNFIAKGNGTIHQPIGTFRGFELAIEKAVDVAGNIYAQIAVRNEITYTTNIDLSGDIGNTTRLDNLINDGIAKKLADAEKKCEQARNDLQTALDNKGKPFEHADELAEKSARLNQLNIELEVGRADEVIMNETEDDSRESPDRDTRDNDRSKPKPPSRGRH